MAAGVRRRKLIGHRRRVEDEGEEEGGLDQLDLDDDSLSDGSLASDDIDAADDSDTSNVEDTSPTRPPVKKKIAGRTANTTNGTKKAHSKPTPSSAIQKNTKPSNDVSDTEFMLNGLSLSDKTAAIEEVEFEDAPKSPAKAPAPIVVSSNSVLAPAREGSQGPPGDRRRTEHEEYRRKRDEDPSFVPNRGAFFMHDHRHAGPSANGFRPFGRPSRGRGRGVGGPFAPTNYPMHSPSDPTVSAPWAHDMHETVTQPPPVRQPRSSFADDGPPNGNGFIPTCPQSSTPINRKMSAEKLLGQVQIRVFLAGIKEPIVLPAIPMKQYTKLPDHRPPLRRDKPVRISLPDFPHRYVFPATDRSFIFIPRAMRPNQRLRGKPRSGLGSIGGFSRRTSVFGGSVYAGSAYSPSIALSRRSSIAPDISSRDFIASPTGSAVSRPTLPYDTTRPIVRLPPQARQDQRIPPAGEVPVVMPVNASYPALNERPQPQTHPLPPKPPFVENRIAPIPMHQPRPQKTVSVASIESPENSYHQAFHQQVPVQVSNGLGHDAHTRHPSYPSQHSTGTPLSQIPERAIHAAPFQPNQFSQPGYFPAYQMIPPQQGYYYPPAPYPGTMPPSANAFVPGSQPGQQPQGEIGSTQPAGQNSQNPNLVAQEVNGMVYYYDASQLPPMAPYPYPPAQGYPMPNVGVNGMITPSPDGYYYPTPGVYYPQ
ncbi:CASC3/Barentsz eIF4AIII binding-domain-containing protein [Xylaria bambusicola]|uniref:CASC3/Barentsz eIF4AIII binding-domain-containing protein n=1 Tax=Xylaria bambusicola TaxID=326684 RepID=UPI0020084BBF|nr:CASC3/Barentsz eIF4AIII binding-domain-containing protein [Xylaria bambusicola]KAI0505950.1 CASC3/Barentsz eIF4AIII binding-domain-containing protein [Xylaria bambusicola]